MNDVSTPILAIESASSSFDVRPRSRAGVSVIMVVYMTGEALKQSLSCVLADPLVDEFIIVDNGSKPADVSRLAELAAREPRVKLITGHGNVGFARGANLGARAATSDTFVFLNPDAFLQPGCLAMLANEIAHRPVPSIVGGRVLNADRTEQRGARRGDITPMTAIVSLGRLSRFAPGLSRFDIHWEAEAAPADVTAVPTISGACFCMRRADFDAVQGFDEGYFLHVEDVDLCWRVRQAGGEVLFHPKAEVVHLGHTSQTSPLRVEFHKGRGLVRFFRKRARTAPQKLAALLLTPLVIGAAVARPLLGYHRA
ncbi:glycosyltransferase family 2 protein [Phenylobacterium immobile]|uniref:glycosyltransferase family 2 protein n=1 Tax=Phenylobacterium immobile TaxID=21 RepID=UPI000B313387|nr:glycosyltransferase family 2 protein [Phenylobacterium immobile]